MRRALAMMAVCIALSGCSDVTIPDPAQYRAEQVARRALFVQCMQIAAQMPRLADDDVSDIVDSCDNAAYYQSKYPPLPAPPSEGEGKP